jgi:putative transposase
MPSRNQIKDYEANSFYHLYSRGVGRMTIFHDAQDYKFFLSCLRLIFSPLPNLIDELQQIETQLATGNRSRENPLLKHKVKRLHRAVRQAQKYELWKNIELLSFCLMPNHFHLVIFQKTERAIELLMRRLGAAYGNFYTLKYDWAGPVMQGRYGADLLSWEPKLQALATARYTERNSFDLLIVDGNRSREIPSFKSIDEYPYSSLKYYKEVVSKNKNAPVWLATKRILQIFEGIKANPNSPLEDTIASHKNYLDFVTSPVDFSMDDLKLEQIAKSA